MIVSRLSMLSATVNEMDLPITADQLKRFYLGELAQRVFPELSAMQREFLIHGLTEEEQRGLYGEDDNVDIEITPKMDL